MGDMPKETLSTFPFSLTAKFYLACLPKDSDPWGIVSPSDSSNLSHVLPSLGCYPCVSMQVQIESGLSDAPTAQHVEAQQLHVTLRMS